jgi:acetylornithine deacetylase/succinyl-diaminopimelate desuccinylase-like protein
MGARRDALAAAAEFVLAVEAEALAHEGVVATVGQLAVEPGAANVVPGVVRLTVDVRHPDDRVRIARSGELLERAKAIGKRRSIDVVSQPTSEDRSVTCAPRLVSLFATAVEKCGLPVLHLASGAGHDVVPMSALTDVAMLFVRCKGGVSHNPAESVEAADVAVAIDVLGAFLELMASA